MHAADVYHLLSLAPLFGLLVWAAVGDARTRRIRNWLTLTLVLTGVARAAVGVGAPPVWAAVAGMAVGVALTVPLVALNAVGGGDLKLLAGVGAWVGPAGVLGVFVVEKVFGLAWVLGHAVAQRRVGAITRNSAVLAANLVHVRQVGVEHVRRTGLSAESVDRPLPYAVPVMAAVAVLAWRGMV